MCTISWHLDECGYGIHFNRDEQKARAIAIAPRRYEVDGVEAVMPIDPDAGGTWCMVNEYGMSVALLNYYQGHTPQGSLISRGNIVKNAASCKGFSELVQYLSEYNFDHFAPFSLLAFSHGDRGGKHSTFRWTGRQFISLEHDSPMISSAVAYDTVCASRKEVFGQFLIERTGHSVAETHYRVHKSHMPERSALSVCMHREDAHTVSYSHLNVSGDEIQYYYSDGAPCAAEPVLSARLKRR